MGRLENWRPGGLGRLLQGVRSGALIRRAKDPRHLMAMLQQPFQDIGAESSLT
jgi:hypothetical protein